MPGTTFTAISLTQLIAERVRKQADTPCVYTGIPPAPGEPQDEIILRSLTYAQVQRAVDRLAWYYANQCLTLPPPSPGSGTPPPTKVIAVLTSTAIDESLLEIALAKLGLTALLLSVNNSPAAVAHLCALTKASHLIYGPRYADVASAAASIAEEKGVKFELLEDKRFPLWGEDGIEKVEVKPYEAALAPEVEKTRPAVILHSSGSTGFPKPVYITHYGLIANIAINRDRPGFSSLPLYHGFGHFSFFRCIYACKIFVLFPPHLPLTSANICRTLAVAPETKECFAVPYVIKLLGETEDGTRALAKFDVVSYAGAALPDDLGDRLTAAGVNILAVYGTTETGSIMSSARDYATDKAWNWVRPKGIAEHFMVMEPQGSSAEGETFECVVKEGYPAKIEMNRPDGSYATKDLFLRHKEHEDWYKYIGRLDDTLVHTLGEKTNPVPIELAIRGNSVYVQEAIVFGAGRPNCGVLLLPSDAARGMDVDTFKAAVWPVIEAANAVAPSHSAILPEMVEVLPFGTDIPVATKMSILRPACYAKFKDVIDAVYARFERGSGRPLKAIESQSAMEVFLRGAFETAIGRERADALAADSDLFAAGVDSLQAARVRNVCAAELDLGCAELGQNIVYEHPSISKLAVHLLDVRSGRATAAGDQQQHKAMLSIVDKWIARVEPRKSASNPLSGPIVVVLTGATGSLGAHILHYLVASPDVAKVVCLSRAKSHADSLERVHSSLQQRRISLSEKQMGKIISYVADVREDRLGLTAKEYEGLKSEVTHVIHNAWPVNFSLSIESFDEHIGGAVNLMNLCLRTPLSSSPASFYFSSSISCRQGAPDPTCEEDFSTMPKTAGGTGYARSKWCVERLCQLASEKTPLRVGVLRIGQMVGDTTHGIWQTTEAIPLLFHSAVLLKALPKLDENPSWLPVDVAGATIVELVLRHGQSQAKVYHVVNPDVSFHWTQILAAVKAAGLEFEEVERQEWIERLAASDPDGEKNPTYKLLPFYKNRYGAEVARRPMYFLTENTVQASPSLRACPPLNGELVGKWINHWREIGFLG